MNIFEAGGLLGLIAGAYCGATFGLQHSIFLAIVGGVVGAPIGYFSGIAVALLFLMPFQLLVIIADKVESLNRKRRS